MICGRVMTHMAAGTVLFNASGALTGGDSGDNCTTPTLMTGHATVIAVDLVQIDDGAHVGQGPMTTATAIGAGIGQANSIVIGDGAVPGGMTLRTILRHACRTLTGGNHTRHRGWAELGAGIGMTQCTICSMQAIDRRGGCYPMTVGTI